MSMMIHGKKMSMDKAIMEAGKKNSKMFELMQDDHTVLLELDMLYPMETYVEMRKVRTNFPYSRCLSSPTVGDLLHLQ